MMITLIFLIMMTTALSTSSVGYVRSREMLRENTGNEFFDSIEDAVAAGHRDVVLASGTHDAIDLRYKTNVRVIGEENSVVSGGTEIPPSMFEINPTLTKKAGRDVYTARNISQIVQIQTMEENGCVHGCSGVPTLLTFGDTNMVLARWPNLNVTNERNEYFHASKDSACGTGCVALDNTESTRERVQAWGNETNAFIHGYFEWDWADCYRKIESVKEDEHFLNVTLVSKDLSPKTNMRFYATNILNELDAPGEYYVDDESGDLHIIPPTSEDPSQWSEGPIFGLKQNVVDMSHSINVTVENLIIKHGVVGLLATNVTNSLIQNIIAEHHSENGILLTNSQDTTLSDSNVSHTGCGAMRVHGGDSTRLEKGNLVVRNCRVTKFALWKRTYEAGLHFSGVSNLYEGNTIIDSPHNCILGGGNEADSNTTSAVDCVFRGNVLDTCSYEAADTGAFYVCGQAGTAFINRNNTIYNNTFKNIRNVVGTGVQVASVQAIYLDDQMSGWSIFENSFLNCQIGSFIGGGRRNIVRNNYYERCDTAQHLDNRGMNWENSATNCTTIGKPFSNTCNTGAAIWMVTESPAAKTWASRFPYLSSIEKDRLCMPAYNNISNNQYCNCGKFLDASESDAASWGTYVSGNVNVTTCL